MSTPSEVFDPATLDVSPEIVIQNDGKWVHFQITVGPVVDRKTFKARHRKKGLAWAAEQTLKIQDSLRKQMRSLSV